MRRFLRSTYAFCLIQLGFVRRKVLKVQEQNLISSIYFHDPSEELFEQCIRWLIDNGFYFISTEDLYNILNGKVKPKKGAVCITVDDGKRGNLTNIVPLASRLNIPVTIFVSTDPVKKGVFWWSYVEAHNRINRNKISVEKCKKVRNEEREKIIYEIQKRIFVEREAMTVEDIIKISNNNNITIGNHTVTHPITKNCSISTLQYEISSASNEIEKWIEEPVDFFAYPNGDFDGRESKFLIKNNIKMAFTTVPQHIDVTKSVNFLQIPRFSVNDEGSLQENICKMSGVWQKVGG